MFTSERESVLDNAGPEGPKGIAKLIEAVTTMASLMENVANLNKVNRKSIDIHTEICENLSQGVEILLKRTDILLEFSLPSGRDEDDPDGGVLSQRMDKLAAFVVELGIAVATLQGGEGSVSDFFKTKGLPDPTDLN